MNSHIKEYLNYFFNLESPQHAVLISGKWGCGKTYFVQDFISKIGNSKTDEICFKPIYISLNGVASTNSVNEKIRAELHPILHSKGMKIAKKVLTGLVKATTKIDLHFDDDDKSDGSLTFNVEILELLKSTSDIIKGSKILIFDDVERCKIPLDEIFGFINGFVEHSNCKVVLVADESKLKEKEKKTNSLFPYTEFKEKLIGQTFEVKTQLNSALVKFIANSNDSDKTINLTEHKELITSIFTIAKFENLRVLKHCLFEFIRLAKKIDTQFQTNENYPEFLRGFLVYFLIVYTEIKGGNDKIKDFQRSSPLLLVQNQPKEDSGESKYRAFLEQNNIAHSSEYTSIHLLNKFIETGHVERDELNKAISGLAFFRKEETKDWEALWHWNTLNDNDFKKLYKSVSKSFQNGYLDNIAEILHVVGIMLSLIENKLVSRNKQYLTKRAKSLILKNLNKITEPVSMMTIYGFHDGAFGKQYLQYDSEEFKQLKKFLENEIQTKQKKDFDSKLTEIFYNLSNDSVFQLMEKLRESSPLGNQFEYYPFFKHLKASNVASKVLSLSNKSILEFNLTLRYRFFPEERFSNGTLELYHYEELDFMIEFQQVLEKYLKREKYTIKQYQIISLNQLVKKIIDKLKLKE